MAEAIEESVHELSPACCYLRASEKRFVDRKMLVFQPAFGLPTNWISRRPQRLAERMMVLAGSTVQYHFGRPPYHTGIEDKGRADDGTQADALLHGAGTRA
jgi:hypothetical protein